MPITKHGRALFIVLPFLITDNTYAQEPEEPDLALTYGDAETVSIATGETQPIARAPAVASVITADQIKASGATDLDQVLATVPGLHVAVSTRGYDPVYVIRGIYTENNPEILMLVNGIPITNVFVGNRGDIWGGMPINDISRIEVIRGPGSAVYGADAFSGVINIITKDAQDIKGTEAGARMGSYDSKDAWVLHGGRHGDIDLAFSLEYGTTDGQRRAIDADAQSGLDAVFAAASNPAPPVSLAPGPVNLGRKYLESRLDTSWENWRFRLGYQGRYDVQTGAGVAQALDPAGSNKSERYNADLTYSLTTIRDWNTSAELSYFDTSAISDLTLFPSGAFGGAFPDGVIGAPDVYERHGRFNLSSFYTGWERHRVRLGTGVDYSDLYKVKETKNFVFTPGGLPAPLGGLVDVGAAAAFMTPHDRTDSYFFAQDEWSFSNDWALTAGVRYDNYSDFGDTVNPRAALVWQTAYNLTSKLLYGHAFRAPSFVELYNRNNPVLLGNQNLNPETIDTVELAFDYEFTSRIRTGLNIFHYHMNDIIRFLPDQNVAVATSSARNIGGQNGYGLEWELNWSISNALKFYANYALQHSEDLTTHADAGNAPHNQIDGRLSWLFRRDWSLVPQLTWVGERQRVSGDPRPPLQGYTLVDVTLRRTRIMDHFELAASVRNIFNADAREPSLSPGLIPDDLPLPGRNFYVEARYEQ